jgi:hypothetical protein
LRLAGGTPAQAILPIKHHILISKIFPARVFEMLPNAFASIHHASQRLREHPPRFPTPSRASTTLREHPPPFPTPPINILMLSDTFLFFFPPIVKQAVEQRFHNIRKALSYGYITPSDAEDEVNYTIRQAAEAGIMLGKIRDILGEP